MDGNRRNRVDLVEIRNDVGQLWGNYKITERLKRQECLREAANSYFGGTYDKKEIDFVEEYRGTIGVLISP